MLLRKYFAADANPGFLWELSHRLKDPFTESRHGHFRIHPLALSLSALALLAFSTFVYFSFLR